jgi:class 3 adenylate cyclase
MSQEDDNTTIFREAFRKMAESAEATRAAIGRSTWPDHILSSTSSPSGAAYPFPGGMIIDSPDVKALKSRMAELQTQVESHAHALSRERIGASEKDRELQKMRESYSELQAQQKLQILLDRTTPRAHPVIIKSRNLQTDFLGNGEHDSFVMAIDIRRSTELMLKARSAELFAEFTTTLCNAFTRIILDAFGVFDKFTGDGVLAFFPHFYSGDDAAYRVIAAAEKCHAAFRTHYQESRRSFSSVLTDVGLGIGVDYGPVRLVQIAGGLTVVGAPVVYACRLSGAPAGKTLLNQPAYEKVMDKFAAACFVEESELEIKHEGKLLTYVVSPNGRVPALIEPAWTTEVVADSPAAQ